MLHDCSLIRGFLLALLLLTGMPSVTCGSSPPDKNIHLVFEPGNHIHEALILGLEGAIGDTPLYSKIKFIPCPPASSQNACRPSDGPLPDLVISVGTRLFQEATAAEPPRNIFAALVPRITFEALVDDLPADQVNRRLAILVEQDPARQLHLAQALLPELARAGIVVSGEPERAIKQLSAPSTRQIPRIIHEQVSETSEIALSFERLLEEVEAVIALPDPVLLNRNNTKWLLYMAANRGVPIFGYSSAYVRAGALAAVYSTPEQVGRQVATELTRWSRHGWNSRGRIVYANEFNIETNATVARRLGVDLPSNQALIKQLAGSGGATDERQ